MTEILEMPETEQAKLLRSARDKLEATNEQLAEELSVSVPTMLSWLRPTSSKAYREMPEMAKKLLARILADKKRGITKSK